MYCVFNQALSNTVFRFVIFETYGLKFHKLTINLQPCPCLLGNISNAMLPQISNSIGRKIARDIRYFSIYVYIKPLTCMAANVCFWSGLFLFQNFTRYWIVDGRCNWSRILAFVRYFNIVVYVAISIWDVCLCVGRSSPLGSINYE